MQFILYLFLGPETRYIRQGVEHEGSTLRQEYYNFRRIDPTPFTALEFIEPLFLVTSASAIFPAFAYAMIFLFGSVMITVEIPQLFVPKFGLDAQEIGLQFIGIIIGSIIGEQIGGFFSDYWMNAKKRKIGRQPRPEHRLWLSYPGILLTIVGAIVFLIQINNAHKGQWNVTPLVGTAFAASGNQIVTTTLVTYIVDTHQDQSSNVGVFITFVRQMWGFIGPFWSVPAISVLSRRC